MQKSHKKWTRSSSSHTTASNRTTHQNGTTNIGEKKNLLFFLKNTVLRIEQHRRFCLPFFKTKKRNLHPAVAWLASPNKSATKKKFKAKIDEKTKKPKKRERNEKTTTMMAPKQKNLDYSKAGVLYSGQAPRRPNAPSGPVHYDSSNHYQVLCQCFGSAWPKVGFALVVAFVSFFVVLFLFQRMLLFWSVILFCFVFFLPFSSGWGGAWFSLLGD